jgi:hypothetical protein
MWLPGGVSNNTQMSGGGGDAHLKIKELTYQHRKSAGLGLYDKHSLHTTRVKFWSTTATVHMNYRPLYTWATFLIKCRV